MKANKSFEITHDSLAAKIWEKISAEEQDLMEVNNILASEYKDYQQRGNLLSQKDLAIITPYEHKLKLDEGMARFVQRSKNFYRKKRMVLIALNIVILLLAAGFIIYLQKTNRKQRETNIALASAKYKSDRTNIKLNETIIMVKQLQTDATNKANSLERISGELDQKNNLLVLSNELLQKKMEEANRLSQEAKENASRANQNAVIAEGLKSETNSTLDAIKLLQEDPTASLRQSLQIYKTITVPELKSTLRRNVYRAFEEILYQQELIFRNPVNDIVVDPDMKYVVIADRTNSPKLWNVESGKVKPLKGHRGVVTRLAIATDGKNFLSVENNQGVIFWDEHGNYRDYQTFDKDIADIKYLGKGHEVLIGYKNGSLAITDSRGGVKERIEKSLLDIEQIIVLKNYRSFDFATLSNDDKVRFWYRDNQKKYNAVELKFPVIISKVVSICLSPNNKTFVLGTDNGFYLFQINRGRGVFDTLSLITNRSIPFITDVKFRDDEDLIVTTSTGSCYNYNLVSKQTKEAHGYKSEKKINRIAIPSNSKYFITAGDDHTVKIWNAAQSRIYSFRTKRFSFSGDYHLSNKDGRLVGYKEHRQGYTEKRQSFDFTPSGGQEGLYRFSESGSDLNDFSVHIWDDDKDTLVVAPILKNRRGLEMVTGIHMKDGMDTVKTIIARSGIIYRAAFSDDGAFILVQRSDIDFSNINFEIYPTFRWILNHFDHYFKTKVYEGD